jgi:hypothetical protein
MIFLMVGKLLIRQKATLTVLVKVGNPLLLALGSSLKAHGMMSQVTHL